MSFFSYHQNNSGGAWVYDGENGIGRLVIVEADNADQANATAEKVGLYFWGADHDGPDCRCCGDRWYHADGAGDPEPKMYGKALAPLEGQPREWLGIPDTAFVHYADGSIVEMAAPPPWWMG